MSEAEAQVPDSVNDATFKLGVALARLPPGPLAELRRAEPGCGVASFWRVYHKQNLEPVLGNKKDEDWEWVVRALALLTPTGNDPEKRSAHDGNIPLGRALFNAKVSDLRIAAVLNSPLSLRRDALIRLVRVLARDGARFDTRELARLLLFADADESLRRLAKDYYAAEAAANKED